MKLTHIDIPRETRRRLEELRKPGETVYAVINRLLDCYMVKEFPRTGAKEE